MADAKYIMRPDEAFMRSVEMILSRKPTPNTYKFAVIRALADWMVGRRFSACDPIVSGVKPEVVPFEQIAQYIVGYYWPIVMAFRLRQSLDPAEEPNVMQLIREEVAHLSLPPDFPLWQYVQQYPYRHAALLSRCCNPEGSLVKAISRLQTVTYYQVEPKLYKARDQQLHLSASAVEFLICYRGAVAQLAIAHWVSYTEELTSSPRVHWKIATGGLPSGDPYTGGFYDHNARTKYARILGELWGDACFYCGRAYSESPRVTGYLVPFTYVMQDRIWNLVLNCNVCRAAKAEQTPPDVFVEKLIARNHELLALIGRSKVGLGNRDIYELNHFGPRIGEHVRSLIQGCRADGFGTWAGPHLSL